MFWSEAGKTTKFRKLMFIHFPGRLSISKGRKQIPHVDRHIPSSLLFTELAGMRTCPALGQVSGVPWDCFGLMDVQPSNLHLCLLLSAALKAFNLGSQTGFVMCRDSDLECHWLHFILLLQRFWFSFLLLYVAQLVACGSKLLSFDLTTHKSAKSKLINEFLFPSSWALLNNSFLIYSKY